MTEPTVESLTDEVPGGVCPHGGCEITYPADAEKIVCPREDCDMVFDNVTEPEEPQEPSEPTEPPAEPEEPSEPPEPAQEPEEPPEPVEPPTVAEEQDALHAEPGEPTEPAPEVLGTEIPASSGNGEPVEPEDANPPGAGDAATPAEVKKAQAQGASRVSADEPVPRPDGCSNFTYQSREFQWVARGGLGNPYGPSSVSTVVFDIVCAAGEDGIDIVDIAVKLRDAIEDGECEPVSSVLQRVSAVVERSCLNEYVRIMEETDDGKIRVCEQHRGKITPAPGMVGERRLARMAKEGVLA